MARKKPSSRLSAKSHTGTGLTQKIRDALFKRSVPASSQAVSNPSSPSTSAIPPTPPQSSSRAAKPRKGHRNILTGRMWRPLEYLGNLQSDTESESKDNACGGDDHKGPDDPAELKCSNSPVSAKFEGNALLVKIPPSADEVTLKIDVLVGGKKFELQDLRHGGIPVPKKPLDSWDLSDVSQSSIMHTPNSSKKKVPPAPRKSTESGPVRSWKGKGMGKNSKTKLRSPAKPTDKKSLNLLDKYLTKPPSPLLVPTACKKLMYYPSSPSPPPNSPASSFNSVGSPPPCPRYPSSRRVDRIVDESDKPAKNQIYMLNSEEESDFLKAELDEDSEERFVQDERKNKLYCNPPSSFEEGSGSSK